MKRKIILSVLTAILLCGGAARAQFYDWGQNPASVRWRTIRTPEFKYIFPDTFEKNTVRIMHYMDTIRTQIGYGFTHGPLKRIPLVIHSQNFSPNGIMMLAPTRMEMIVTPGVQQFAFPNLKQLSVHEYRHAVQYNNLNRGFIRVFSWILGEQGAALGLGLMPVWAMEGDAVLAETQMSTFGRGLQPSFSIEYRAMAIEGRGDYPADKYFSGSFKDFMPNHYQLGYQILSWADDHYGENVLDKAARFSTRNLFMIFPFSIGLNKHYGTTEAGLLRNSLAAAYDYWRSLPLDDDTAQIIPTPLTSYTAYSSPLHHPSGGYIALKSDLDRTSRLMWVDGEGGERVLCRTGNVNSPLSRDGNMVYWTELRQSAFWEQRVYSQLCSYNLETGKTDTYRDRRNVLFPVVTPNSEIAAVEYAEEGVYSIVCGDLKCVLPDTVSVHGLTCVDGDFYFIGLSDSGMWIGSAGDLRGGFRQVTTPGFTTLSYLTSGDGVLYFNSIASGKDEVHMYDLSDGREYRITTSRYGSFAPSVAGDELLLTTYTIDGYLLSRQDIEREKLTEVSYSRIPANVVNPPRRKWSVMNMDGVTAEDSTDRVIRKYRKGLNLFNFHSWAPAYYEADRIISEARFDVNLGVSLFSQNHLNSTYTQLSYGWTGTNNLLHGKFNYYGWAPKFELEAQWSDQKQAVVRPSEVEIPELSDYLELSGRVYLPFRLSSGANFRTLTPSIDYQYNNTKIYDFDSKDFKTGIHKVTFGLQYVENHRMAHRDFLPRFGYAARVNFTTEPVNDEFGRLFSAFGRVFLPGIAPHHSIMIRGAYQKQSNALFMFRQKELFPRGADFNAVAPRKYAAVAGDYQFPVWYPDGGINSLLYFRRVRLNLGGDYARFIDTGAATGRAWQNVWSYGGDVIFDIVPIRLPSNTSMTLTFSIRKPSDSRNAQFGFSASLPL